MPRFKEYLLHDQHLLILPDRALFWREQNLLVVADPHFGKAQIFRDTGIPIPAGTSADDLKRLSCLIDQLHPSSLLFLGDLIHGRMDRSTEFNRLVEQWRRLHSKVQMLLSTGNHDLRSGEPPAQFHFDHVAGQITLDPFVFTHKPQPVSLFYTIAGHVHPAVTVTGKGRLRETLPCFSFGNEIALLPAFGGFTGTQMIHPTVDDQIFVIAGNEIIEMQKTGD